MLLAGAPASATPGRATQGPSSAGRSRTNPASLRAQRLGLGNLRAAGRLLAGRVEPRWLHAAGAGSMPKTLRFPVAQGWFVRGFGSGEGGYHQAVDIGGQIGWNVRAAAEGIVGYAGDQVPGYGNLIILVHPQGFITTYAHNSKNLVVAGQRVQLGAIIAQLGSTGLSKGPHVHFELLFSGQNCDPGPLFRPSVRRKNGALVGIPRSVWKQPNKRPRTIKCHVRKRHPKHAAAEHDEPDDGESAASSHSGVAELPPAP